MGFTWGLVMLLYASRELYDSNQSLTQDIIQKEEFQKNLIDNLVDALIVFDL